MFPTYGTHSAGSDYKKQSSERAIYSFARAIELNPSVGGYHYHLGLAHIQSGATTLARAALERALETGVDTASAADIKRLLGSARGLAEGRATT